MPPWLVGTSLPCTDLRPGGKASTEETPQIVLLYTHMVNEKPVMKSRSCVGCQSRLMRRFMPARANSRFSKLAA